MAGLSVAIELTPDDVDIILGWVNVADFEGGVDEDELPLVNRLAGAVGDDPYRYACVRRSLIAHAPLTRGAAHSPPVQDANRRER